MLDVDLDGPVLRLTLARPEVRNALNEELIERLSEQFSGLRESVRVVVLSGRGPAFCAGGDLAMMRRASEVSEEENFQDALKIGRLWELIASSRAAVVAQVHGSCFGGGCGLVAAADITISDSECLFAFSEVRLGLIPATIANLVIDKIGRGAARSLFVTGEAFNATRALAIGLIQEVSSQGQIEGATAATVAHILRAAPEAIAAAKAIALQPSMTVEESARLLAVTRSGQEAKEGVAAFLEKRRPGYAIQKP